MRASVALLLLGTACGEKDGMGSVSGAIAVSERDLSADVEWDAAFAYAEGDRLIAFFDDHLKPPGFEVKDLSGEL